MAAPMFFFDANVVAAKIGEARRGAGHDDELRQGEERRRGAGRIAATPLAQNRKWNQAEAAGKASAGSCFPTCFRAVRRVSARSTAAVRGGTVEPMDPTSRRVSQAFGDNDVKSGIVQTASALASTLSTCYGHFVRNGGHIRPDGSAARPRRGSASRSDPVWRAAGQEAMASTGTTLSACNLGPDGAVASIFAIPASSPAWYVGHLFCHQCRRRWPLWRVGREQRWRSGDRRRQGE